MGFAWMPEDDDQAPHAGDVGSYGTNRHEGRHYYRDKDAGRHRAGRHAEPASRRPGLAGLGMIRLSALARSRAAWRDDGQHSGGTARMASQASRPGPQRGAHAADRAGSSRRTGRRRPR
ncbi:MAG: hypothetical protein WAL16_15450 [Streptosporangiaceae bacterium]